MEVLGVRVDNFKRKEILEKVFSFLSSNKFHQIATINPEFILQTQKDRGFREILNSCDLNIADGFGIKLAFWRYGKNLKCRMAGVDLMRWILKIAERKNLKVFLAANKNGLSTWEKTREAIHKIYPQLQISGENIDMDEGYAYLPDADVVFCNFGAPEQEKFLNGKKNGKIRLAMGVGGSFDYLTGKVKRAPQFIRAIGFEWFWRLLLQPNRWKRIWNAVIVFPIKVIFNKYNG